MTEALYEAMKRIGIDERNRRERRIDFHSWRHWYNAFLVNHRVPVHKVRSIVGHTTDVMTEKYYHGDQYDDVRLLMNEALTASAISQKNPIRPENAAERSSTTTIP
jgi:integrase